MEWATPSNPSALDLNHQREHHSVCSHLQKLILGPHTRTGSLSSKKKNSINKYMPLLVFTTYFSCSTCVFLVWFSWHAAVSFDFRACSNLVEGLRQGHQASTAKEPRVELLCLRNGYCVGRDRHNWGGCIRRRCPASRCASPFLPPTPLPLFFLVAG